MTPPVPPVPPAAQTPQALLLTIDEDSAGQRLDNFLMRHLKGVPKTHVYRIIRSGEVRINRGRASADTRINTGDVLRLPPVRVSERANDKALAMAAAVNQARVIDTTGTTGTTGGLTTLGARDQRRFPVLYEDDWLLAIDKPAGVAVHGGSGVSFGVIEQLRIARPQAAFLELVHRLDRDTSGILLIAKKRSALKHLQDQFRERETGKTYLALVSGTWPAKLKVIDAPLHKYLLTLPDGSEGERRVKVVGKDDPNGMRSITLVKVAKVFGIAPATHSLLEVTIKTGRTHQIRVHLASQGHPIAGDDKYGNFEANKALAKSGLKRMFLHAWRLSFAHPQTGDKIELNAALPPELAGAVGGNYANAAPASESPSVPPAAPPFASPSATHS
jgi:23S rRNA pseudouridine955/2504/2580 synthase